MLDLSLLVKTKSLIVDHIYIKRDKYENIFILLVLNIIENI